MKENLAAALLAIGHADVQRPLLDPFCGAGTLAIEQAMRALRWAPGRSRRFAIDRMKHAPPELRAALAEARQRAADEELRELPAPIELRDLDPQAVDRAREAVARAGLGAFLLPQRGDARKAMMPGDRPVVVGNPPFGERLGRDDMKALADLHRDFGAVIKRGEGTRLLLFTAYPDAERALGLGSPERQWPLYSGPLKTMLYRWER
jgi:putative N6-adenine-specific DNA methylase